MALALDLSLRGGRGGKASLDDVMRELWRASGGGPISEADIVDAVKVVAGARRGAVLAGELLAWVHGTDDLPLPALLERAGVKWQRQPATLAERWGLRVSESALTGVKVTAVLRGGAAERAGLAAGDELLAVGGLAAAPARRSCGLLPKASPAQLLVSRDQRVLTLALAAPARAEAAAAAQGAVQLSVDESPGTAARALRKAWLAC